MDTFLALILIIMAHFLKFQFTCRFVNFPQEQKLWDEIKGLLAALQSDIVDAATQTKKGKQSRCQAGVASEITWCPAYNGFGFNEHSAIASRFFCIKIIDYNVKKFGYNENAL